MTWALAPGSPSLVPGLLKNASGATGQRHVPVAVVAFQWIVEGSDFHVAQRSTRGNSLPKKTEPSPGVNHRTGYDTDTAGPMPFVQWVWLPGITAGESPLVIAQHLGN